MADELTEAFEQLRLRSRPVPLPRELPTSEAIDGAEQRAGLRFHSDFRRYLMEASDVVVGTKEPVTIGGGHTDLGGVLGHARTAGIPQDWIPLCEDNGDYFCVTPAGEVVYWSHDGATDERWPDIATWITEVWIDNR